MKVKISSLPKEIQKLIPLSIRTNRDEYLLSELPSKEREIIREYLDNTIDVSYGTTYDIMPNLSKYSDFTTLSTVKDTIASYLTNYFYLTPGAYPFDPEYGCELKYQLQTKDTQLRKLLITDQINQIVNAFSSDFGLPITVKSINIKQVVTSMATQYLCTITISIPGEENIVLSITQDQL